MTIPDLLSAADTVFDEMVDTRRALHRRPELSMQEHGTTELIRGRLHSLGIAERGRPTETGGVFTIEGGRPGRTVVLRADIDGLPVQETTNLAYASAVDGCMHACGHDVHTAALLGVARVLSEHAGDLPGRFVLVFQPGEEALCGARSMIDGGALDGLGAASLVGCHVASMLPAGLVALRPGVSMSEAHSIRFVLHGTGGHGAMPTAEGDVVRAIGRLIGDLSTAVDGLTYEGTACVCSAGMLRAGTAVNVVPDHAVLEGTLRTFTAGQRLEALGRLEQVGQRLAGDFGISVDLQLPGHTPAVVNDAGVTAAVEAAALGALGAEHVLPLPPVAPSDDVSEFLNRIPGCYFFVGGALADGSSGMHHSPTFALDEESLRVACSVLTSSAVALAAAT